MYSRCLDVESRNNRIQPKQPRPKPNFYMFLFKLNHLGGGSFQIFLELSPRMFGEIRSNLTFAYFSNGLIPPTSFGSQTKNKKRVSLEMKLTAIVTLWGTFHHKTIAKSFWIYMSYQRFHVIHSSS